MGEEDNREALIAPEVEVSTNVSTVPVPVPATGKDGILTVEHENAACLDTSLKQDTKELNPEELFLLDPVAQAAAQNVAMEHRIFLQAILQLLAQRDQLALGADVNDPYTIKIGPLKKASHLIKGVWKVKYVEIRKGLFSYYEDAPSTRPATGDTGTGTGTGTGTAGTTSGQAGGDLLRKSIPLRASTCTCRPVKVQHMAFPNSQSGFIFELTVSGSRRLWMANSKKEREAWIHAVRDAMVGKSVVRGESSLDYEYESEAKKGKSRRPGSSIPAQSPFKNDLIHYLKVQTKIKTARSKTHYLGSLKRCVGVPLNVPVQWIREHVESSSSSITGAEAFREEDVSVGMKQLWKDMLRDSVSINGKIYKGDDPHGPERIMGALARCIMRVDRSTEQAHIGDKHRITEAQALSYARDVLLACNRTRSGGDSYYCFDTLCNNSHLVALCPSSTEADPMKIVVGHAGAEQSLSNSTNRLPTELSGWLNIRHPGHKNWKSRFCVLSAGMLSYYEQALPRPHGLRGQVNLTDASIDLGEKPRGLLSILGSRANEDESSAAPTNHPIMRITTREKSKEIRFLDQMQFSLWSKALEKEADSQLLSGSKNSSSKPRISLTPLSDEIATAKVPPPSKKIPLDSEIPVANLEDTTEFPKSTKTNNKAKHSSLPLSSTSVRTMSSIVVSAQASTQYKICTLDPQGDDKEDTWAMVQTQFLQGFRLSGGVRGRIIRGEEIVQLNILEGLVTQETFDSVFHLGEGIGSTTTTDSVLEASLSNIAVPANQK